MAGYSGKPLVQKLGIRENARIVLLREPAEFRPELEPLPAGIELRTAIAGEADFILLFARDAESFADEFAAAMAALTMTGMLWVAWPKRASGVQTDLTETVVRDTGLEQGLVDVKVCAINAIWSGLKFVRRVRDRI